MPKFVSRKVGAVKPLVLAVICALSPRSGRAAQSPVQDLYQAGNFTKVVGLLGPIVKAHPMQSQARILLIRACLRLDGTKWRDAEALAKVGVQVDPQSAAMQGLLSLAYMRGGRPSLAITAASAALATNPNSYYALVASSRVELWNGDKAKARATLQHAVTLRPKRAMAYYYLLSAMTDHHHENYKSLIDHYIQLHAKGYPHTQLSAALKFDQHWGGRNDDQAPAAKKSSADGKVSDNGYSYSVPMYRQHDDVILPVRIRGVLFHLLLDTGAGDGVVLNSDSAERLGIQPNGQSVEFGASGEEVGKSFDNQTMLVGRQEFDGVSVSTVQRNQGDITDGLIGGANFKHSVVTLDFTHNQLVVSTGPKATAPPPAPGDALMTVPFHYYDGYIFVKVRLADEQHTHWALLDTGCEPVGVLSLITARRLAKAQRKDAYAEVRVNQRIGVGTTDTSFSALVFRFAVDLTMKRSAGVPFFMEMNPIFGASLVDSQVSPGFNFQICGIVGIPYLTSARRVTIDYPARTLTLELPNN